ncbi:Uncharacterised protein [uncultured Clostridium sp.]|nr:Uncharacterised protein [uncultured Clostridium sp.]
MSKNNILKFLTVSIFLIFIFIFPIINILTPDKTVSTLENKILTQLPKLSIDKIKNGYFMENFDKYTEDQFPYREEFISFKNSISYMLGNREFRNIYITKNNRLLEKFIFNKEIMYQNISQANNLTEKLYKEYKIKSKLIVIPTSIAFYEEELPSYAITDNQQDVLNYIKETTENVYTPYNILKENKDKYIYFNTDHHWTQLGAMLAYSELYNKDLSTEDELYSNYKKVTNNFLGSYYSKAILPTIKGDSIYSYKNYNNHKIEIDFDKNYNTLYDNEKLEGKNKYQYFLHGDPAHALIEGNKNKEEEILILKDSFAHNFIPLLANEYKKIHVIDPRYYTSNLEDYIKNNPNIKEVLTICNIQTLNQDKFFPKTTPTK